MLRKLLRTTLGLLAAVALFLLTLEALLAIWPGVLPPSLGNHAFSKYGSFPGGIYYFDPVSDLHFMRPDFETRAYFNGYSWDHRTDEFGFRNPPELEDRSLLLLGDSLIYGHGVEEVETVAHFLRSEFGRPAYNMGRQGDCLLQSYVLLRLNVDALQAETVVLFVFLNDFADAGLYRNLEEMRSPPEIEWNYVEMREHLDERAGHFVRSPKRLLLALKSVRLLRGAWHDLAPVSLIARAEAANEESMAPSFVDAILDRETFERTSDYYRRLLRDLDNKLGRRGIELQVVHLDLSPQFKGRGDRARLKLDGFLQRVTTQLGIPFATTEETFAGCEECFLPEDGHLSGVGHRRLATFVDVIVNDRSP